MKTAWVILVISAFTDFVITVGTAITSAMVAAGNAQMPNKPVVLLALIGGAVSAARTIQQALRKTDENTEALTTR